MYKYQLQLSQKQFQHNPNRQEILFNSYVLQKKGRTFGTEQIRTFRVEESNIIQMGGKQDKILPLFKQIILQEKSSTPKWNQKHKQYGYRLALQFQERTPIWIYFKTKVQTHEILAKLASIHNTSEKVDFTHSQNLFNECIRNAFLRKLLPRFRMSKTVHNQLSPQQIVKKIHTHFNDKQSIMNFLIKIQNKIHTSNKTTRISLNPLKIYTDRENLGGTELKVWIKGQVIWRMTLTNQFIKINNIVKQYKCGNFTEFQIKGIEYKSTMNLQLQHQEFGRYKSQRFNILDLRKKGQDLNFGIFVRQGVKFCIVNMHILFKNCTQKSHLKQQITPLYYPIISEIYSINYKVVPQLPWQIQDIHKHHLQLYNNCIQDIPRCHNFHSFRKLYQSLKIQDIMNKFYINSPFCDYIMVENKGNFIYEHFVSKSEKFSYYDVERIIWKYPHCNRRILSSLKCFDQNPRINFTYPFGLIVSKLYLLCSELSYEKWLHGIFQTNIYGVQAMSFFLALGLLKAAPSLFIYNPPSRRTLQYDSLLFHYTLKTAMPKVYQPLIATQINIQALFGQQYLSFFSSIVTLDIFQYVLELFVTQNLQPKEGQYHYQYVLIGTFLAILQLSTSTNLPLSNCQTYLLFLKEYFNHVPIFINYTLRQLIPIKVQLAKQCSNYSDFLQLRKFMQQFYNTQFSVEIMSKTISQLSQVLYQEFSCYQPKKSTDLRKAIIIIDAIQLNSKVPLNVTVTFYQQKVKLYEHSFHRVNPRQINHSIEIRLSKIQDITLSVWEEGSHFTYFCHIDPKVIPSNYYHYIVSELTPSRRQIYKQMYVCYQLYIKDKADIDYLQNSVCQKYINTLFLSKQNKSNNSGGAFKQDVIYVNNFHKTVRTVPNNLNLLYTKLNWYGNHYLLPFDRILHSEHHNLKNFSQIMRYTRCVYGRATIPYPKDTLPVSLNVSINNICVQHFPKPSNGLTTIPYDTASQLLCYPLSSFQMHLDSFFTFYYELRKAPLIHYLTYQPLQFYLLPTIKMQLHYGNNTYTIILTNNGKPFKTNFTEIQIEQIQLNASNYETIPNTIQFQYCRQNIDLDSYLNLLRLNVLSMVFNKKQHKWGNFIRVKNQIISNLLLFDIYPILIETKSILILQLYTNKHSHMSYVKKDFRHFGHVNGKWTKVAIFAKISCPSILCYYIECSMSRKKLLMEESDIIICGQIQRVKQLQFTEKQLTEMRQCVINQLNKLF